MLKNQWFVDTKLIGTEDALFTISAFYQVDSAVYLPNVHSHYRKDNQQSLTSGAYKRDLVNKWREMYRRIYVLLEEHQEDETFYAALENRRALGVIQLGLGISSDSNMSLLQKRKELKDIISSPDYKKALRQLPIRDMPFHWKIFFLTAKGKKYLSMLVLLAVMNRMRKVG